MTGRAYATFDTEINGLGELTGANTLDVAKVIVVTVTIVYVDYY
jgi:hypothetical protein